MKRLDPRAWPITIKVPLAVAVLMVLVGLVLSERVVARLGDTQERHFRDLARSYLEGLSSSVTPSILRDDTWEVFDAIERAQELNKGLRPLQTIVANADMQVVAASDPRRHPVGSGVSFSALAAAPDHHTFSFEAGATEATAMGRLAFPGRLVGVISASFDTSDLATERRNVILALAATNGILTLLLAVAGWLLVARMMRPVRILTEHLGAGDGLAAKAIPADVVAKDHGDFRRLFEAFNSLVGSMDERELLVKRLAGEERLGSLGRLASALAHEINNPLGGLFNALATLKTHGHMEGVRAGALGILERGLVGIRDVVRTTLTVYRSDTGSRRLLPADLDDIALLVAPQARRKSVAVLVAAALPEAVALPATPIRQAVLNLLLNAVAATPEGSQVDITAMLHDDALVISVEDRGDGLPDAAATVLTGLTSSAIPRQGGGLGLWTTRRLIEEMDGRIEVARPAAGGTLVRFTIPLPHAQEFAHVA
jgi:signal transduction histidine kinase